MELSVKDYVTLGGIIFSAGALSAWVKVLAMRVAEHNVAITSIREWWTDQRVQNAEVKKDIHSINDKLIELNDSVSDLVSEIRNINGGS